MKNLYLHIPYCAQICPYCDFYKTANRSTESRFVKALIQEIQRNQDQGKQLETLYWGGGTPSLLSIQEFEAIFQSIRSSYGISDTCEVTVEMDPGTFDKEKADALFQLGVNRISLGVQSFVDEELQLLGRGHSAKEAVEGYQILREVGFQNISVDLMIAQPKQNMNGLRQSLEVIKGLKPEHVSVYTLDIEPDSVWGRMQTKDPNRISFLKDEAAADLMNESCRFLIECAYGRYEVSSYAINSKRESCHNKKYWAGVGHSYEGLGPSAHAFDGDRQRSQNIAHVGKYIDALEEGLSPRGFEETLSDEQQRMERIFLGLRTREGLSLDAISDKKTLISLKEEGYLLIGEKVVLTDKGMNVYNKIVDVLAK